ncbi:MAG: translation initiation factor IF-2 subunit beta [Candidatus Heimdallarchaeota archaeon]|nr:translation initiation factor IF-2 subunit beta [Candidatus Heimdallarchaeota archaeon]
MSDYNELLKRAREHLPEKIFEKSRFEPPKPDVTIEGNRTFFKNWHQVVVALNRDENHMLKFLTKELATSANIEGQRAVFSGKHNRTTMTDLVNRYMKEYLICPECDKPDTKLIKEDRITFLVCEACGARTSVKAV